MSTLTEPESFQNKKKMNEVAGTEKKFPRLFLYRSSDIDGRSKQKFAQRKK
jgi:hypothetical protein